MPSDEENRVNQEALEVIKLLRGINARIAPLIRNASPALAMELGSIVEDIGNAADRAQGMVLVDHCYD